MNATIQYIDDTFIVRLPASIIKYFEIKESEVVEVFEEHGRIVIQKSKTTTHATDPARKTISELFEGYEDEYEPVPIDWGTPVGMEIW
jgi:antitoxin component of MazEF toxin-antitoxin module